MSDGMNDASAKLLWSDPRTGRAREFALRLDGSVMIGRAADSDVHLPEKRVSRQHARLSCQEGRFHISDLGSTNGTAVNSQMLTAGEAHPLQDGDAIVFGITEAQFRLTAQDREQT